VSDRRARGDLIETFKIARDMYDLRKYFLILAAGKHTLKVI